MKQIALFILILASSALTLQVSRADTEVPPPSGQTGLFTETTPSEEWRKEMTTDFSPAARPQLFAWGPPPTEDTGGGVFVGVPVDWNRRVSALFALFASLYIIIIYKKKNHQTKES